MSNTYDHMRRADINRNSGVEYLIHLAMTQVEKLPADERLTDAVALLAAARTRVADYVDGAAGLRTYAMQALPPKPPRSAEDTEALRMGADR